MTDQMIKHKIENVLSTHLPRSIQNQEMYNTANVFQYDDGQMTD